MTGHCITKGNRYSKRQKEGWKKLSNREDLVVKYWRNGINSKGKLVTLDASDILFADKVTPVKINDHGDAQIANTNIFNVPVDNWKNYPN